jgi:hypothetical protein
MGARPVARRGSRRGRGSRVSWRRSPAAISGLAAVGRAGSRRRGIRSRRRGGRRGVRGRAAGPGIRRRGGRCSPRKQSQRVDVALLLGGDPDAEVDVRLIVVGRSARPDRPGNRALRDRIALVDRDRAEVAERHGIALGGLDGDRLAVGRHRAGERDGAGRRRQHVGTGRAGHVDAAMLACRIGVGRIEVEPPQHLARRRPGPGMRGSGKKGRAQQHEQDQSPHMTSSLSDQPTQVRVPTAPDVVNLDDNRTTAKPCRAGCARYL